MCLRQASSLFESIVYYFFFSVLLLVTLSDNQWKSMYLFRTRLTVSFTVRSISESAWQCWFIRAAGRLPIDIKIDDEKSRAYMYPLNNICQTKDDGL